MTTLPPYHTPLSASNGANVGCAYTREVIQLENADILAGSNDPQALGLFDEEPDYQDPDTQRGYQW